ncbi:MAG: hypothetical protein ACI91Z_001432 [Yoonia sp.]
MSANCPRKPSSSAQKLKLSVAAFLFTADPPRRLKPRLDWQNQQCYPFPWWCISFGCVVVFQQQFSQIRRQPSNPRNIRFSHNSVGFVGIWILNGWYAAMALMASKTFTLPSSPELGWKSPVAFERKVA